MNHMSLNYYRAEIKAISIYLTNSSKPTNVNEMKFTRNCIGIYLQSLSLTFTFFYHSVSQIRKEHQYNMIQH